MVKIIAGLMGSSVQSGSSKLATPDQLRPFLDVLRKYNVNELDTARVYNGGKSEELLGQIPEAKDSFTIETKAPGFSPGSLAYDRVVANCNASIAALKLEKIPLYYFHGPDRQTPIEDSCRAINQLHEDGKIEKFGISNFKREEVEQVHSVCKSNGWVLPTVYQGGVYMFDCSSLRKFSNPNSQVTTLWRARARRSFSLLCENWTSPSMPFLLWQEATSPSHQTHFAILLPVDATT